MTYDNIAAAALEDIAANTGWMPGETSRRDALRLLLTRYSVSPKHLCGPGPSDEEIWVASLAALRSPDHDKLYPFRFVVSRGDGLERLADLFEDYGRRRGREGEALQLERARAQQAPVAIGVVARIATDNADVPPHDQWACVGGAISNALTAFHFMGYAGKMLSGVRAADPVIRQAYCRPSETLVGWMSVGTPRSAPIARGEIDASRILSNL